MSSHIANLLVPSVTIDLLLYHVVVRDEKYFILYKVLYKESILWNAKGASACVKAQEIL